MNAEGLLKVYQQISEAPDAVGRLRSFILELAVRGKLLPQELSEIAQDVGICGSASEAPYELPSSWRWMKIGDQLNLLNGMAFKPTDWISEGLRIVRIQNLNNPNAPYNHCAPDMARDRSLIDDGSFLISWSGTPGTSFGAFIWDRGPAVLNQHIFRCDFQTEAYEAEFLKLAINGRLDEMIEKAHGGVGLRHITKGKLQAMLIAVPPLAEQHRIVAKVDELMGLCDRLEAARVAREEVRDKLTAASLARLAAPDAGSTDTPDQNIEVSEATGTTPAAIAFHTHARFALDTLPALTSRPDQIKTLRQTILNLAVRGKLTGGNDAAFEKVGKFRKLQNGYAFKSSWYAKEGVRLLRNANVGHGEVRWQETVYLPEEMCAEYERFSLNEGDVVLTLDRPFIVTGTKVARVTAADLPSLLLQRVGRFVEVEPGLSDDYLFLWINSPHFNEQIDPGRSNGVPHISSKQVEAANICVPPLAEQHRIVAKVDALMALCDRLEAALTTADTTRTRLLNALLHEALTPATPIPEAAE